MDARKAKLYLQILALLHIVVGLLLPFLVDTWLFNIYNAHLLTAFNVDSAEALALGKFMTGILGPTVASWGVLFLYLVNVSFDSRSRKGWFYMVVAIVGWSFYDMYLSVMSAVYWNVIIDLVALGLLMAPLVMSRQHFFSNQPEA